MKQIYLDNCLTSKPAAEVVEAMLPYLGEKFHFPKNFVQTGSEAAEELEGFRRIVAASMGASPEEIHFTTGGTSANNLAIKGFLTANVKRGSHIILSAIDYPDLLANASFFESSGFQVTYLSADRDGLIDLEQLRSSLRPDTVLFMTTLANHVTGTIQPLAEIRKILNEAGHPIALLADACEAYARMPINVKEPVIDLMSVSAHKIHGPQGVGALYIRKGTDIGLIKHGITRLDTLETGGISMAAIAGFAKAVELAFTDLPGKIKYLKELRDHLLERIESSIPHTILNGPRGDRRISHNLNVSFSYIEGEAIMMMLDLNGILVNTGSACASQGLKANYVLMALGRTHEESHGSIKFTLSRYNTREEIDFTVDQLAAITAELRSRSPLYNKE